MLLFLKVKSFLVREYSLLVVLSITLLCTSQCGRSDKIPYNAHGDILIWGFTTSYSFSPLTQEESLIEIGIPRARPHLECKIDSNYLLLSLFDNIRTTENLLGLFKYHHGAKTFQEVLSNVKSFDMGVPIDYLPEIDMYLFFGRGPSDTSGFYTLKGNLDQVHERDYHFIKISNVGNIFRIFFIDANTFLIDNIEGEIIKYSINDQKKTVLSKGNIGAISHNRKKAVFERFGVGTRANSLYDLENHRFLDAIEVDPAAFCFSPNDSFVACLHRTNDIRGTVELKMFDIHNRKLLKTSFTGRGDLVWVSNSK